MCLTFTTFSSRDLVRMMDCACLLSLSLRVELDRLCGLPKTRTPAEKVLAIHCISLVITIDHMHLSVSRDAPISSHHPIISLLSFHWRVAQGPADPQALQNSVISMQIPLLVHYILKHSLTLCFILNA